MKTNKVTPEVWFYALTFVLALGIRFYQLGAGALSDGEATWALQALDLARGHTVTLGGLPGYLMLTSLLFSLIGSTNSLARFIPALSGSLLVWLPFFFRGWMGDSAWRQRAGLVMAFGLALDPGLVSISRQVGSPMPALAFTLLALACLYNRRMVWSGVCAGLAVLSGPAFLQGLLILGVSWGIYLLVSRWMTKPREEDESVADTHPIPAALLRVAGITFLFTLLAVGTLLFRHPQGLGALAESVSAYVQTFLTSSGIPYLRLPASLLVYQLIAVLFGLIGAGKAWLGYRSEPDVRRVMVGLSIWVVIAIILPFIYVGRQVSDLSWALVPLWALASLEISRSFLGGEERDTYLVAGALGVLLSIFAVIGWFNFLAIGRYQANILLYAAIIAGAFLLGLVAVLLVMTAFSSKEANSAASLGMVWSLCLMLGLFLFAGSWGMSIVRQNGAQELWSSSPTPGQVGQLMQTLTDLSSWNTGLRDQLEVVDMTGSPAMQWALRDFPFARSEASLASAESPPVVITLKEAEEPRLVQEYRSQDFIWRLSPGWQGVFPTDFINWLAFRKAPLSQEQVILWTRTDSFPGGGPSASENATP
ncbi:MAG: hypothetical protein FIA98_06230 [Anaerolineae bacterium]|nr:hypothetical protein [Anaerolineae bacterium]